MSETTIEAKAIRAAEQVRASMDELAVQLRMTGGGEVLLRELGLSLIENAPVEIAVMREALEKKELEAMRIAAAALRGQAASLGAELLLVQLSQLEAFAEAEDFEGAGLRLNECEILSKYVAKSVSLWIETSSKKRGKVVHDRRTSVE